METLQQQANKTGVTPQAIWAKTEKGKANRSAYRKTKKYKAYNKAYMKEYHKTEKFKAYQKNYQKTDKYKIQKKNYDRKKYKTIECKARWISKRIKREKCIFCENLGEKHHLDYNKPLDVIFLCREHHVQVHKGTIKFPSSF